MPKRTPVPDEDYGAPLKYDPNFRGPLHRRSCTDLLCLLLFVIFIAVWVAVGTFAIMNGDVKRLLVPTDSDGRKCGLDSGVEDKPYLVFFDLTKCLSPSVPIMGCATPQVCVKSCPTQTLLRYEITQNTPISQLKDKIVCKVDVNTIRDTNMLFDYMDKSICAEHTFKSKSVLGRCLGDLTPIACNPSSTKTSEETKSVFEKFTANVQRTLFNRNNKVDNGDGYVCLRNADKALDELVAKTTVLDTYIGLIIASWMTYFSEEKSASEVGVMIIEDLVNFRWWIVTALIIVMIVCFIYIVLMRWIATPMVWFSIFGVIGILSYCIYLAYDRYAYLKAHPVIIEGSQTNLSAYTKSLLSLKETWLVILIIICVVLLVIVLAIIFLRKRIVIAIALIKEGSKAVSSILSTVFFPIFPWIFQCFVLAACIIIALYLHTIGESSFKAVFPNDTTSICTCNYKTGDTCVPSTFNDECLTSTCKDAICHFVGISSPGYITGFFVIDLVGFFWLIFFIDGLGEMILASTFATWYWTFHKSDVPFFTLATGIGRVFRYHLGTIAFGSLIITICRLIRVCLEYLDYQLKKYDNMLTRAIMCCLKCFFKCLESFLRFINKNAYIMCAVHGKGFFSSARDAFSLLMRNILRVFVLDKVTDFLFFLSKLIVTVGCGVAAYYVFTSPGLYEFMNEPNRLHYNMVPVFIVAIAAYLIATIFFSVYCMAVDTLFLCFLEDCERNDGTPEKPYFMSKELLKILGKRNKLD